VLLVVQWLKLKIRGEGTTCQLWAPSRLTGRALSFFMKSEASDVNK